MSRLRAFIYVQHLLGIGHLKRAASLARALAAAGTQVTLASGGFPVRGLDAGEARLAQLPPAGAADLSFRVLVDEQGRAIDEEWKRRRREALLAAWHAAQAQVLVVELFPFGRRQMRFELMPLLEAAGSAAPRPLILSSVRDVLGGQRSRERQDEALEVFERHFDRVLVHSDPSLIRLDLTFPHAARIARRTEYTGYIVEPPGAVGNGAGRDEVIVSAGGGAVGAPLLEAALRARPLTALRDRTWRLLSGTNMDGESYAKLERMAAESGGGRVVLERARGDFTTLLANCALSVSQAGYNTLMETLQAGARAVVVPFARGSETEQTLRARCFADRGLLELVEESALTAATLAAAIDRAWNGPRPVPGAVDFAGAEKSARLIEGWAAERAG